jgi:4-amino-4-deoxy-L-arabinose transferase-like glycosyltransferase
MGRARRFACPALIVLAGIVFALVFTDYGVTWDEGVQSTYGELVLDYFASAGADRSCNEYSNLFYYGPLFDGVAAAVYGLAGGLKYEIRHALTGLAALLTLIAVWRFGKLFGSPRVPIFALLALLMMPRFIGHAFNNPKDIPFACAFAWAMVGIGRLLTRRSWSWIDVLLAGGGIGVALSVRVGALMLFAILATAIATSLVLFPDERRKWSERRVDRGLKALALVATAWTLMTLGWPWIHAAPLTRPFLALAEMSDFSFSYMMLFAGDLVRGGELPRHYVPAYLAITTPLSVVALAGLGLVLTSCRRWTRAREPETLPGLLVLLWLLLPLGYVVLARPVVYDGIRHFLFLFPALALLAGVGAAWIVERLGRGREILVAGLLVVVLALTLRDLVVLHPYQSSYFNETVGGVGRAWRNYDADYWASSYREAVLWVRGDSERRSATDTVVVVACNEYNRPCAETYLTDHGNTPGITMHCVWDGSERLPPDTDYYIGMFRYGKAATFFRDWPVVHRIGRQGAVFSVIKRRPDAKG